MIKKNVFTNVIIGSVISTVLTACSPVTKAIDDTATSVTTMKLESGQNWWAGVISHGEKMPLVEDYQIDMEGTVEGNQIQPLLLSANGHVVWSEAPFALDYSQGNLTIVDEKKNIISIKAGKTLKQAYQYASQNYFPPSGKMPDDLLLTAPQFNTRIELTYNQNQMDIIEYARDIIKHGFKPGVLMIDDTWQESYGKWDFHPGRFPNPKGMIDELHQLGFKVMLWVAPFVSGDIPEYRTLNSQGAFVREVDDGKDLPRMVDWWNGQSAVLDLSNPVDIAWFKEQLDFLQRTYKVDGFKFDAGDAEFYTKGDSHLPTNANEHAEKYAEIGLDYPLNEYRATWKMGGKALAQRLRDKNHTWDDLTKLVPQMNLLGIMGYPFACPDMIGGGNFESFLEGAVIDQELIVRSAQAHALMPMMQFSVAPWRVLDDEHLQAVKQSVKLRDKFSDYILETAKQAAISGEPIMRPMEYDYPHQGFDNIKDQFLIGERLLVAPIVQKGITSRNIQLPKGKWKSLTNDIVQGPKILTVNVNVNTLPVYQKVD